MRRVFSPLLVVVLAACAAEPEEQDTAPWASFDAFSRPGSYTVQRGDTLGEIAHAQGVTVAELRAWNGIEGDLIEVHQILLVWKHDPDERTVRAPVSHTHRALPVASLPPATVVVEVRPAPPPPRSVSDAGVLGALQDDALSHAIDPTVVDGIGGLTARRAGGTSSGLATGGRAGLAGGVAEAGPEMQRPTVRPTSAGLTAAPVHAPRLVTPAPKRCLAGPSDSDLTEDSAMVAGAGLSERQIRDALDPFVRHTSACIPAGSTGGLTVTTEITVGCDGRVSHVEVVNSGGAPAPVTGCIAETLALAGFPAHDLPDGQTFGYPITYRF